MKQKIGALALALGLTLAIPALAYPTAGTTKGSQSNQNENQTGRQQTEKVKLNELPQAVQNAINQHAENGKIKHIDRVTENGTTFYKISLKNANGEKQEFRVNANGQYLGPQATPMNQTAPQNENNVTPPMSGGHPER